jgi:hypothetical protein
MIFINVLIAINHCHGNVVKDFGPYGIKIYDFMCCYNRFHGNVKVFWALWDNFYECVFTTSDFPVVLDGQSTVNCIMWKVDIVEFSL